MKYAYIEHWTCSPEGEEIIWLVEVESRRYQDGTLDDTRIVEATATTEDEINIVVEGPIFERSLSAQDLQGILWDAEEEMSDE